MSEHKATVKWSGDAAVVAKGKFSRAHTWSFDGGLTIAGSASPSVVPPPLSDPAAIDPEEAFVASLSSCHMLTFLFLAYRAGFVVTSYEDQAVGKLSKSADGTYWMSEVTLNPRVGYEGKQPSAEELTKLHDGAHHQCFIANSVKTEIRVNAT